MLSTKIVDSFSGEYVLVCIADTGTGISSENLNKIFTPLLLLKDPGKGTGLGLPIVMRILKTWRIYCC
ncbi:MAG: hypothetical protein IPK14_27885 [Blastocatellia bacterium]|nr:hypothetical protein [Blastocatellia bacterium]